MRCLLIAALCLLAPAPAAADQTRKSEWGKTRKTTRAKRKRSTRKRRRVRRKRPAPEPEPEPAASDGAFTYDFDLYLVEGKSMGGIRLGGYTGSLGLDVSANLIWLSEPDPSGVVDEFVGSLFGFHLYGRVFHTPTVELRIGTGFDVYPLFGINADEVLCSWPAYVEGRFWLTQQWGLGAQLRYSLIHSDGLEPGVDRAGAESIPLMLVLSIGGRS